MKSITKKIGEKIRQKREIKNISRENMALKLNLSDSAYGKLERGETKYDIERLKQIAEILDTTIADLIDETTFYSHENIINSSKLNFNNSTNTTHGLAAFNSIAKTAELLPSLVEKQNVLMEKILALIEKNK